MLGMLNDAPSCSPKGIVWLIMTAGYSRGVSLLRTPHQVSIGSSTDIVCGKNRKISHYIASMLPHQGSYALWRATTQPFKGATGKFVASGPFCCPCACPLTPIGIQLTLGVACHSTNKGAAIFDKALVSKKSRGTVTRATHG